MSALPSGAGTESFRQLWSLFHSPCIESGFSLIKQHEVPVNTNFCSRGASHPNSAPISGTVAPRTLPAGLRASLRALCRGLLSAPPGGAASRPAPHLAAPSATSHTLPQPFTVPDRHRLAFISVFRVQAQLCHICAQLIVQLLRG